MPVCPNCRYEYEEGIKVCPDCGTPLVDNLVEDEWIVVYTSDKDYEIQMLKDELESAGITANILSQKDHNFPVTGDLAVIKLLVPSEDATAAAKFIDDFKKAENNEEE
ncbi:MAG TPA: zinc-ribbon domain-containing protein [Ignavibacteriaceae bacterium]|jgi:predicted amidophosphoribosyltransferase|nr:zinc-ribbon domain-containing protein [Ignavibacteriaceae bacterium]